MKILDGAMGTMIQRLGLTEEDFRNGLAFAPEGVSLKGCNDVLCLTRPDAIYDIHTAYLEAGADIIETNTFNSNALSLSEYRLNERAAELAAAGAAVACRAVDDYCARHPERSRPQIAGSMGPSGVSLSIAMQSDEPECDFDRMAEAYRRQAAALIRGGVDILLLETIFDTLNAKAAIYGIRQAQEECGTDLPLMLSVTLTEQGRLLSGQTLEQFIEATRHACPASVGLNCGFGAEAMVPWVRKLRELTALPVSVHPNAGLPDAMGRYTETPDTFAATLQPLIEEGIVQIVGGCCGTTPEHIRALNVCRLSFSGDQAVGTHHGASGIDLKDLKNPKDLKDPKDPFTKVGERCNVAGSRKFLRLVKEGAWQDTLDIARGQLSKGAAMLDINTDDGLLDAADTMCRLVRLFASDPDTASVPLMIDSSDFEVIRRALRLMPLRGVVNSISLKNGPEELLARAKEIHALGAAMVVMAFDEQGQATTLDRRIEICSRAYRLLTEAGIPAEDIIFDPNILAVATGIADHDRYALDFIEATRWIRQNLPGAGVSGGVSNLSFSFRGIDPVRRAMHAVFLEHAIRAGMTKAIINPATPLDGRDVDPDLRALIDDVILARSADAPALLLDKALAIKKILDEKKAAKKAATSPLNSQPSPLDPSRSPLALLAADVQSGDTSHLEEHLQSALDEVGDPMRVVSEGLMAGMNVVGDLFGSGQMFLPQVVRAASVLQKAVAWLTPHIEARRADIATPAAAPVVVLATVKGDVHDIGKNIVAIVLRCAGFEVVDLGVMTPAEDIVAKALETHAAAIGVSGLITPSLAEMGVVAETMQREGLHIPLFVGGATTSDLHTAVRLAPQYDGPVVHTSEAASLPGALRTFTAPDASDAVVALTDSQAALRADYMARQPRLSLEEARRRALPVSEPAATPKHPGIKRLEIPVTSLVPLINWRAFLHEWGIEPSTPKDDPERLRLLDDANKMLISLADMKYNAKVALLPARSDGDDILVDFKGETLRWHTPRALVPNPVTGACPAQADSLHPDGDSIGAFVVTDAGTPIPDRIEALRAENEYQALLLQSLSHRLVEAATERMHRYVRKWMWGIPHDCGVRPAVGYPSLPDQRLVFDLDKVLNYEKMGVRVTENGALWPSATTTGLIIGHPTARYFRVEE